ncbi:MAG: extracellular solute-binding protein [Oscillospiraceae bacterium]|nr:extracellular solute-binding protein [Oscillospiraceae bacterium]
MKKYLSLILAALMVLALLTGCANTPAESADPEPSSTATIAEPPESAEPVEPAEPVEIVIWHENNETIAGTIQEQLSDIPGVTVKLERKEQMSDALKMVGNDPEAAPDMYLFAHDKIGVYAAMGILAPITEFVSADAFADIMPMAVDATTYKGEQYSIPIYFETLLFMYNKALMDAPPATTDELLELMKSGTTADSYVFVEQHSTSYNSAPWIQGFGGYILNSDAAPGLGTQEFQDALAYHKQFIQYQPSDGEYNTVTTLFTEGKAASTIGGPWLVPDLNAAGLDLGISAMPTLPNGEPLKPFSGVQGIQVLKHAAADKPDAVKAVLEGLLRPEVGIALANIANSAPVNLKAYDDPDVAANEMIMVMRDIAANVVPMPNIPEMDVMWTVTDNLLAAVNKNGEDIKTTCEAAQAEALEQIAAMQ